MADLITTLLELAGLVGLCIAAGLAVAAFTVPGGIAVSAAGLLGSAWLIGKRNGSPDAEAPE